VNISDDWKVVKTFYFNNVPNDISIKEIGMLEDVFIANKLNRQGLVFGFACFRGVNDLVKKVQAIRNVWFGKYKTCELHKQGLEKKM